MTHPGKGTSHTNFLPGEGKMQRTEAGTQIVCMRGPDHEAGDSEGGRSSEDSQVMRSLDSFFFS